MLPAIAHLLNIHLSSNLHLKIRHENGEEFRGGRAECVCLCGCICLCVCLHVFEEIGWKRKGRCVCTKEYVEEDCCAAISNNFCFVIQQRFKSLEGGNMSIHINPEDTQTG